MGFKVLTPTNYTERDEANDAFGRINESGQVAPVAGADRARAFLAVELGAHVAQEVRDLFEVARGTMLYGEFFYPLYTLGDEQTHRVADAAAHHRYLQLGGELVDGRVPSFRRRIAWLIEHGAIPTEEEPRWDAYRELRNIASHPDFQQLHSPVDALASLRLVAQSVDALFRPPLLRREPLP
jgi:hypothetical protein